MRPRAFVERRGHCLVRAGVRLRFAGSSAFYLQEDAARELLGHTNARGRLASALDTAERAGVSLLRIAAFNAGGQDPAVVQAAPGQLAEAGLRGLDRAVAEAGRRGFLLLIVLTNYWDDYGGAAQYLRWRGLPQGERHRLFTDARVGEDMEHFAVQIATRVNTVSGLRYADDPAIAGWEVMNEPRGNGLSDQGETIARFVGRIARALKRVAPRQLVVAGDEGFDVDHRGYDVPYWRRVLRHPLIGGGRHESFRRIVSEPDVDVATVHWYPDWWGVRPAQVPEAGVRWIREHARIARALGKPILLEEFGLMARRPGGREVRSLARRRAVLQAWFDAARAEPNVAAVMPWGLSYPLRAVPDDPFEWGTGLGDDDVMVPLMQRWHAELTHDRDPAACESGAGAIVKR